MKLSIIIPMYNAELYIENLLDSIYHQQKCGIEFETIIIDDCSTDNCVTVINRYIKKNQLSNLRLIEKDVNGGTASSRNSGIDIAVGEYIQFVDSDDYLQSNYFELVSNSIYSSKDCYIYGIAFEHQEQNIIHSPKRVTDQRMIGFKNSVCNKLYSSKIIHHFNPQFSFEDVIWLVEVINNQDLSCEQINNLYYHVNRTNQNSKMANFKQAEWKQMAKTAIINAKNFGPSSRAFVLETFVGTLFSKSFKLGNRLEIASLALLLHIKYLPFVITNGIRKLDDRKIKNVVK